MINVLKVLHDTTVDGPGFRTSIYCAGCRHQCPGCHNPQSWAFGVGKDRTTDDLLQEILADPFADVTFTGGDPLFQAHDFAELAKRIKKESDKNIWCYTGFLYEDLLHDDDAQKLLQHIDVLVDGRFIQALRDEDLLFRGSTNQRLIDVPRSRKEGCIVLWQREE
ncbi:MAG: anaerobic ribonucleoside-triphosphate reductase activating protein [Bacteroidaceae bacterium]|nr:anaerobic ribonucleoside-triphosphate reductase activating protein [Bacteroidaceae bacterium]